MDLNAEPSGNYNIYGFIVKAYGSIVNFLNEELKYFLVENNKLSPNLIVWETDKDSLPIKEDPLKDVYGIDLKFDKEKNVFTLLYEKKTNPLWIYYLIEAIINWDDKCFLHAAGVEISKNEAIIFAGKGNVGKTKIILSLLKNKNYKFLGDDQIVVDKNGYCYPFPRKLNLYDYHLFDNLDLAKRLFGLKCFLLFFSFKIINNLLKFIKNRRLRSFLLIFKEPVRVSVQKIYPDIKIGNKSKIVQIFWLIKDTSLKEVRVLNYHNISEFARKMASLNILERNYFFKHYYEFCYRNEEIDVFEKKKERELEILESCFAKSNIKIIQVPEKISEQEMEKLLKIIMYERKNKKDIG